MPVFFVLRNGQYEQIEISDEELAAQKKRNRIQREESRFADCSKSLIWLGRALRLPVTFNLGGMLRKICLEGSADFYYPPRFQEKSEGGRRIIIPPKPELKYVQRQINALLHRTFKRDPNTFGHMGGRCYDVALRHSRYPSTLKFDLKDAFFQVRWTQVRKAIRGYREHKPGFSSPVAYWISKLCTYSPPPEEVVRQFPYTRSFLAQGAPSSPICFHLACAPLDYRLARIAQRVDGIVSRYADNYYFSMPSDKISKKLERMIVCSTERNGFPIHKVRKVSRHELCRILGHNIIEGNINNTRDFRRNFRGAVHVLETRLDNRLEWQYAYNRVRGLLQFAVNLPPALQRQYELCERKIAELSAV